MTDTIEFIHPDLRSLAIPIAELNEDPDNANTHGDDNLATIAESFKRFGQRKPLVVRREGMIVEAGNGQLAALRDAGWTHLACTVCDDDAETAKAYAMVDNQAGRLSVWNFEQLRKNAEDLLAANYDVIGLGFAADSLADLLAGKSDELGQSLGTGGGADGSHSADTDASSNGGGDGGGVPDEHDASADGDALTFSVVVDFNDENQQAALLQELETRGLRCRLMMF